jgi:hypothetical protein
MPTDRQADMIKLIDPFLNFAKTPRKETVKRDMLLNILVVQCHSFESIAVLKF